MVYRLVRQPCLPDRAVRLEAPRRQGRLDNQPEIGTVFLCARGELRGGEFAGGEVQFAAIDAFAGVGLRVCADEHPELAAGRVGGGGDRAERGRRESENGDEEAFHLRSHVNSPS